MKITPLMRARASTVYSRLDLKRKYVAIADGGRKAEKRYFDATSEEAFRESCLKALKWFHKDCNLFDFMYHEPDAPELGKEHIETLPPGKTRDEAERLLKQYKSAMDRYDDDQVDLAIIDHALKEKDPVLAYSILATHAPSWRSEAPRFTVEVLE